MAPISKEQQDHCKLAQYNQALTMEMARVGFASKKILLQIDDVNFKILSNKTGKQSIIGGTALHFASIYRHSKSFKALQARGADITVKNNKGDTPLLHIFQNISLQFGYCEKTRGIIYDSFMESMLKVHVKSGNAENPHSANGLSHFHIACALNYLEAVQLFLNSGVFVNESVNINSPLFPGSTPLHFAVRCCGYATAKLLIERGADVGAKDAKGFTPLHLVIERNLRLIMLNSIEDSKNFRRMNKYRAENEKIIRLFLEDNRVMDVDDIGFCKFHAACTLSDTSLAKRFMKYVDVNSAIRLDSPICPGFTALHFAVQFNDDISKLLLKNGANIEAKDLKEVTPFDIFTKLRGIENVYDILSAIPTFKDILFSDNQTKLADFILAMRSRSALEKFFKSTSKDVHLPNDCPLWPGYHLSHLVVLFSKLDPDFTHDFKVPDFCPTRIYLSCGGNSVSTNAHGCSPIHLALYQNKETLIDLFFERQLILTDVVDHNGLSHLQIACQRRNSEAVRILLSTGVNVNSVYKGKTLYNSRWIRFVSGSTPLHIAMSNGNVDIIKRLLEYGVDVNLTDTNGMTAFHRFTHLSSCMRLGEPKVMKEIGDLLSTSCELKNMICSKNGLSHIHFASYTGNADVVERLLKLGADPNAVFMCMNDIESSECSDHCSSGLTPMHFAMKNADNSVVELLLKGGVDILHKKSDGMTLFYDMLKGVTVFSDIGVRAIKTFSSIFAIDETLQKRVQDDSGLTLLHIACFLHDVDQIERLLTDSRVDVNAQMHANSPIWPKATPLHFLIDSKQTTEDLEYIFKLLLDSGANVTLSDNEDETPIHKIWRKPADFRRILLRLLLRYQMNFSINPVNREGISHFHLACAMSEYAIVEKFLEHGVDVNLPVDFHLYSVTFQTPLQFMLRSRMLDAVDSELHIKTVDVLLKYGADVNAQDEMGSTPFLTVAGCRSMRKWFFQKLYKAGADVNFTDIHGRSVLEIIFNSEGLITSEDLQILLDNPNLFISFNSSNGIGIVSKIIDEEIFMFYPNRKFILDAILERPNFFTNNSIGRTPIHNLAANPRTSLSAVQYAKYIEKFMKMNFDIDAQDSRGETALHLASYFQNEEAVFGLLIAGADVNITDMRNRMFFHKLSHKWHKFHITWREYISKSDKLRLKNRIAYHIITMQECGLEINLNNLTWANGEITKSKLQRHRKLIMKELRDTKLVSIGTGSLTLRDFLSETGAIASRPSMMYDDREAVDIFFRSIDNNSFPHLKYLFKLQYRKMLKRLLLIKDATHSLSVREIIGSIDGFSMPEICCRKILRFLTNADVKNVILSVSTN